MQARWLQDGGGCWCLHQVGHAGWAIDGGSAGPGAQLLLTLLLCSGFVLVGHACQDREQVAVVAHGQGQPIHGPRREHLLNGLRPVRQGRIPLAPLVRDGLGL